MSSEMAALHEVLHLMGFGDRYSEYGKTPADFINDIMGKALPNWWNNKSYNWEVNQEHWDDMGNTLLERYSEQLKVDGEVNEGTGFKFDYHTNLDSQ